MYPQKRCDREGHGLPNLTPGQFDLSSELFGNPVGVLYILIYGFEPLP